MDKYSGKTVSRYPPYGAYDMHLQTFEQAIVRLRHIIEQCQAWQGDLNDPTAAMSAGDYLNTIEHTAWGLLD